MPIAKAAAATPKPVSMRGPQCAMARLMLTLNEDDYDALTAILRDEPRTKDTHRWISDFLEADGHGRLPVETINRHRVSHPNNECCVRT